MARHPKFTVGKEPDGRRFVNVAASVNGGKRKKVYFPTKKEAQAEADRLRIKYHNHGAEASKLPLQLQMDAERAVKVLEPYKTTLHAAAEFYAAHREELARSVTFAELVDSYIGRKKDMSERERGTYGQFKKRYGDHFGDKVVAEIGADELEAAIETHDLSAASFNTHRRYISVLFNHAILRKFAKVNLTRLFDARTTTNGAPVILTPAQAKALMEAAQGYEGGAMVGFFAVALFAGLRPQREAGELLSENVDLEAGHIYVTSGTAKTSTDRYVNVSDNLKAWLNLSPDLGKSDKVTGYTYGGRKFKDAFDKIRETAGIKGLWSKSSRDILRHTFSSMHWAQHHDQPALLDAAGHGIEAHLKHYKRAVRPADAEKFWAIMPR